MAAGNLHPIFKNPLLGGFIVLGGLLAIGDGFSDIFGFTFPIPAWIIAALAGLMAVVIFWTYREDLTF